MIIVILSGSFTKMDTNFEENFMEMDNRCNFSDFFEDMIKYSLWEVLERNIIQASSNGLRFTSVQYSNLVPVHLYRELLSSFSFPVSPLD